MATKIAWTDESWNPVVGCTKVSEGCQNCYAEKMMHRQVCMGYARHLKDPDSNEDAWIAYSGVIDEDTHKWNGSVALRPEILDKPLHWRKPRKIFVCSMGDLFQEAVPFEFVDRVMSAIVRSPQHIFQILTKRIKNAQRYFSSDYPKWAVWKLSAKERKNNSYWPISNLWLGVTCENQKTADERIPILLEIPAAVRFVSLEPLLGPIDLTRMDFSAWETTTIVNVLTGEIVEDSESEMIGTKDEHLDWVIIGCESGPNRRECKIEWVRDIVNQCNAAHIPVFVKQLSINGKVSRDPKEWPEDLRIQEFPKGGVR